MQLIVAVASFTFDSFQALVGMMFSSCAGMALSSLSSLEYKRAQDSGLWMGH